MQEQVRSRSRLVVVTWAAACLSLLLCVAYALPVACPPPPLDQYKRYVGPGQNTFQAFFCLAAPQQSQLRAAVLGAATTVLQFLLTTFVALAGRRAYQSFVIHGVSADVATTLLEPAQNMRAARLIATRCPRDSGRTKQRAMTVLVLALMIPPLFSLVGFLTPLAHTTELVRQSKFNITVTSIADAAALSKINLTAVSDTYEYRNNTNSSLIFFESSPTRHQYGSGLQTMRLAFPAGTAERDLGIIPLRNMLTNATLVPNGTADFSITQEVLLVNQTCAFQPIVRWTSAAAWWQHANLTGARQYLMDRLINPGKDEAPQRHTHFTEDDVAKLASLVEQQNNRWFVYIRERGEQTIEKLINVYDGNATLNVTGIPAGKLPIQFTWTMLPDDRGLELYTTSMFGDGFHNQGRDLVCKTQLIPIRYNTSIPSASSAVRRVPMYEQIKLGKDDIQLVKSALKYSEQIVEQMNRPGFDGYGTRYHDYTVSRADGDSLVRACTAPMDTVVQYGDSRRRGATNAFETSGGGKYSDQATRFVTSDSCIGTEFDLLLKSSLLRLSYVPPATGAANYTWGPLESVTRPQQLACVGVSALYAAVAVLVAVLYVTAEGSLCRVSAHAPATIPWAALMGPSAKEQQAASSRAHEEGSVVMFAEQGPGYMLLGSADNGSELPLKGASHGGPSAAAMFHAV